MWQILLLALAISFGMSVANRRRRWVWFAWTPAAAIAAGVIVFVTWLIGGTTTSGPGAIGAGIVMLVFCLGLAGGGTVLWLLWRWRPIGDAAASAHPWRVVAALIGWLVILTAVFAATYAITRVEVEILVTDPQGVAVPGAKVEYRVTPWLLDQPLASAAQSRGVQTTDPSGRAVVHTWSFTQFSATVSKSSAPEIIVVSIYRRDGQYPGYRVNQHVWESNGGKFGRELERRPQFECPLARDLSVPVVMRP